MPKFIKYIAIAGLTLILMLVTAAFGLKGFYYLRSSLQVQKINSCLESGGCMEPKTLECGPYVPNDPNVMCGPRKTQSQ